MRNSIEEGSLPDIAHVRFFAVVELLRACRETCLALALVRALHAIFHRDVELAFVTLFRKSHYCRPALVVACSRGRTYERFEGLASGVVAAAKEVLSVLAHII